MLGAIAGDIIGSVHERHPITITDFPLFDRYSRFTDDTVMTVAVADAILTGSDYGEKMREWYNLYPDRGYGPGFRRWAASARQRPRPSMGNGSAMRVSPVGWAFDTLERVLEEAGKSAEPSHDHPEGIKGAQAVSSAIFMARHGSTKAEIKRFIEKTFGYYLGESLEEIRKHNHPSVTCPGSVPQAITAFLLSTDFEDAVRKAVSMGGDADTVGCIAGGIAEAFYGEIPHSIVEQVYVRLPDQMTDFIRRFRRKYVVQEKEKQGSAE